MRLVVLSAMVVLVMQAQGFAADRVGDGVESDVQLVHPIPATQPAVPEAVPTDPPAVRPVEPPAPLPGEKVAKAEEPAPATQPKVPESEPLKPLAVRPVEPPAPLPGEKLTTPEKPAPVAQPKVPESEPLKPLAIRPAEPPGPASEPLTVRTGDERPTVGAETGPLAQANPIPEPPGPLVPLPEPLTPQPATPTAEPSPTGAPDLAGDLPGSVAARTTSPFHVEMEDFKLAGTPSPKSKKTMAMVAELKKLVGLISRDLDVGGTERTRLVFNTECLSKEITALAEIWREVPPLMTACVMAKRASLVLEEELRNEPRRWTHVRWAFQDCQKEVKELRRTAARLAALEPELVRVERKGKVYYVEPEKSPEEAALEEEARRLRELKEERDRNREREEDLKETRGRVPLQYGQ